MTEIAFPKPLAENAAYSVVLPRELKDNAGRPLANAASFPLKVATGAAPPIAKFAAAPFGIVERNADAMLPVTLRHVQAELRGGAGAASAPAATSAGQVRVKRVAGRRRDPGLVREAAEVPRDPAHRRGARPAEEPVVHAPRTTSTPRAGRSSARSSAGSARARSRCSAAMPAPEAARAAAARRRRPAAVRGGRPAARRAGLPRGRDRVAPPRPGAARQACADVRAHRRARHQPGRALQARAREQRRLGDDARPRQAGRGRRRSRSTIAPASRSGPGAATPRAWRVVGARARCELRHLPGGQRLLRHRTQGRRRKAARPTSPSSSAAGRGESSRGASTCRPAAAAEPDLRAATVFDRSLFRAGETVVDEALHPRRDRAPGLSRGAAGQAADRSQAGASGQRPGVQLRRCSGAAVAAAPPPPGTFRPRPSSASTRSRSSARTRPTPSPVPAARVAKARRGSAAGPAATSGSRSSACRWSTRACPGPRRVQVAPASVPVDVQMSYFSGGADGRRAAARFGIAEEPRSPGFAGYDEFSFEPPRDPKKAEQRRRARARRATVRRATAGSSPTSCRLTTDRNGAASFTLKDLPKVERPSRIDAELSFADPNGETQTIATRIDPLAERGRCSACVPARGRATAASAKFTVLALDTSGKPIKGQSVAVKGRVSQIISHPQAHGRRLLRLRQPHRGQGARCAVLAARPTTAACCSARRRSTPPARWS